MNMMGLKSKRKYKKTLCRKRNFKQQTVQAPPTCTGKNNERTKKAGMLGQETRRQEESGE